MIRSALVGYFMGAIPFALLLAPFYGGRDPRTVGSGNPGAANVLRTTGLTAGLLVAFLDAAKGSGSVLLARWTDGETGAVVAGLAAVIGHVFPVWLGFRGGKGVATACGVFAVLASQACAAALGVFVLTASVTRYVSAGSVAAALSLPPLAYLTGGSGAVVAAAGAAAALVVARHWANLIRMVHGTERPLGRAAASRKDA